MKTFTQIELLLKESERLRKTAEEMSNIEYGVNSFSSGSRFMIGIFKKQVALMAQLREYPISWIIAVETIINLRTK